MKNTIRYILTSLMLIAPTFIYADNSDFAPDSTRVVEDVTELSYTGYLAEVPDYATIDMEKVPEVKPHMKHNPLESIYAFPYSVTARHYDWRRLWLNTGVLAGTFVGTLLVLECLPEDATSWNRAEIRTVPLFKRWREHVIDKGPEWDHDKFVFNYVLHPYAGAAYYMTARSCGFNAWQSLLYATCISTIGWEFGIEAFMERPSIQDLFITPLVGSLIGEGFYKLKRKIVDDDYCLGGSPVLGNIVVFLIDPVNEVIGLFAGNPARKLAKMRKQAREIELRKQSTQAEFSSSFIFLKGDTKFGLSCQLVF